MLSNTRVALCGNDGMCLVSLFTQFVEHNAGLHVPWGTELAPLSVLILGADAGEVEHASSTLLIKLEEVWYAREVLPSWSIMVLPNSSMESLVLQDYPWFHAVHTTKAM